MHAKTLCNSAGERNAADRRTNGQRGAAQLQHEGDAEIAEVCDWWWCDSGWLLEAGPRIVEVLMRLTHVIANTVAVRLNITRGGFFILTPISIHAGKQRAHRR